MDLEFKNFQRTHLTEIGLWLDEKMPNLPLLEQQRWSVGESNDGTGRFGVKFSNDQDAIMFSLRWLG